MVAAIDVTMIGQAVLGIIAIIGFVLAGVKAKAAVAKVDEIHILVNSQRDHLEQRILVLEEQLRLLRQEPTTVPEGGKVNE